MGATIRRNDENSRQAERRAIIGQARRRRQAERNEERFYDDRALSARAAQATGR